MASYTDRLTLNTTIMIYRISAFLIAVALFASCRKDHASAATPDPATTTFIKGADVSWVTEMEAAGKKFYNANGSQQECMSLMKSLGMNTVRFRIWSHDTGWCGLEDTKVKIARAKALGLKVILDFHYSDTWADPGHQAKPAAWASQNIGQLKTSVYNYSVATLSALKTANLLPDYVQVGNETDDGMLWPEGRASASMSNFAQLVQQGYAAIRSVDNNIKVIVHLSNGNDNAHFRWIFDGLSANGAHWDIIGMSMYPPSTNWQAYNQQCLSNMNDMVSRYGKPVMIVEAGMSWDSPEAGPFLTDLIAKTRSVTGNNGLGVLYWEPEAYGNWQGYPLGAFDNSGKPMPSLNAFQ